MGKLLDPTYDQDWHKIGLNDGRQSDDQGHKHLLYWINAVINEGVTSTYREGLITGMLENLEDVE